MALTPNNTQLVDAILTINSDKYLNKFATRRPQYAAYNAFRDNTEMLVPASEIERVRTSERRPVKIALLDDYAHPTISVRSCDIACPDVGSSLYTMVWATIGFDVCSTPAVNNDNYISAAEQLAFQIDRGLHATAQALEILAVAELEANKTLVVDAGSQFEYTFDGTAYQVSQAQKDQFYLTAPTVMEFNDVNGKLVDVTTLNAEILQKNISQYQLYNQLNRDGELSPSMWDFYRSKFVTNDVGVEQTHYITPEGSIGTLGWIDFDSRMRTRYHESKFYDTFVDPMFNMEWGVYYSADCYDASAQLAGLQATKREGWKFTRDFAFLVAKPDAAGHSPIHKFEITNV